ncbi:MAG: DUF839 domain-containing protein [Myxococcales bacterium FL481]|nr:MAG: DUF839 domain-containing protein [Myxococcales bacterium FL481]
MRNKLLVTVTGTAAMAIASTAAAGTDPYFNPLTQSAAVGSPNHINEVNSPWIAPAGVTQTHLTDMAEIEGAMEQSVIRVPGLGRGASMWDMVAFDDSGDFAFIPHETFMGAGVTRYDLRNDKAETLFAGDLAGQDGDWSSDWGAFDPCTFTPNGTLFLGEEWSGEGRIMEVLNPFAPVADIQIRELESIANVSHEGIRFSHDGRTIYYVDEWNSGSIYKFVSKNVGDYTVGQTFVLVVKKFDGVASDNWNDESNEGKARTGRARWVKITDRKGNYLTEVDPFRNGPTNDPRENDDTRGGRPAADEVNGTPYGRPEDMEIGKLANGNEVLYFAATSEKTVYAVEMTGRNRAYVRAAASEADTPKNLGFASTTGVLNSPDNLAQDALGNIYIIEDAPNGSDVGGDIWFMRDTDSDGVAESLDHFLTLQVNGSEATGMIFNPKNPTQFVVAVQHPQSTDLEAVPGGQGDALWQFDITNVVPPACTPDNHSPMCQNNGQPFVNKLLWATGNHENQK